MRGVEGLGTRSAFGGRPAFPFGTGGHPRNCVRVRFPPPSAGRPRIFSKSYGLYFVLFPSHFPYISSYFLHISSVFLHISSYFPHVSSFFLSLSIKSLGLRKILSSHHLIQALRLEKIPRFPPLNRLWDLEKFRAQPLYRGFGTRPLFRYWGSSQELCPREISLPLLLEGPEFFKVLRPIFRHISFIFSSCFFIFSPYSFIFPSYFFIFLSYFVIFLHFS